MLPAFEVKIDQTSCKWTPLPCDVWRMEIDQFVKDVTFRKNQHMEVLLPFKYMGRWLTCVWDSEHMRREVLSFSEVEFPSEQWKEISVMDAVIF